MFKHLSNSVVLTLKVLFLSRIDANFSKGAKMIKPVKFCHPELVPARHPQLHQAESLWKVVLVVGDLFKMFNCECSQNTNIVKL